LFNVQCTCAAIHHACLLHDLTNE